jgi:HSP20 family protein
MAKKLKKSTKTQTRGLESWSSGWSDMDRTFDNFRKDLERSFGSFPSLGHPSMPLPTFLKMIPSTCDVIDEGKQLRVKMNVPGVKRNEIDLNVTDNSIEITAGHKEAKEEKKKNFLRKERSEVSYYRTLPLPEKVHSSKAKAKLTDGVLDVIIPKITPTAKPKKQSIRVQ